VSGIWGITPKDSVSAECGLRGKAAVVGGCIDLIHGREVDNALIVALGGPLAELVLTGRAGGKRGYWPRVWAARGLLYAWDDRATDAVIAATADDAWRVREMAAKVVARHLVGDAFDAMTRLRDDHVERVRGAAERALRKLVDARA
jgi:hypothetical protein